MPPIPRINQLAKGVSVDMSCTGRYGGSGTAGAALSTGITFDALIKKLDVCVAVRTGFFVFSHQ
jgi:hypothetical protein